MFCFGFFIVEKTFAFYEKNLFSEEKTFAIFRFTIFEGRNFRENGQKSRKSWKFLPAKVSAPKINIANGSSLITNESSFEFSLGKKIKFHQLYNYIKSNREYVYNRGIPQSSCLAKMSVSLQML